MHILIAPNAFKNSLPASNAADAIQAGLAASSLQHTSTCFPIADGGDGTAALIAAQQDGKKITVTASDPLGRKIAASFYLMDAGQTALIEMADASGLSRLTSLERNPLIATSYGTGQLIKEALDLNVKNILLTMGGSATVDGGTGILRALGIRFLDDVGNELIHLPTELCQLKKIDTDNLDPRISKISMTVLCDVDNRLLGEKGAAKVFGPQKGATTADTLFLDTALKTLSDKALKQTGIDMSLLKYGGTAGGAAAGLHCFLGAALVSGIDYFLSATHFDLALAGANLLITAEGSIDEQTLEGKGPAGVAIRAKQKGIPVIGLAGKIPAQMSDSMKKYFDQLIPISKISLPIETALKNTAANLFTTAKELGDHLSQ